ncbi:MAG: ParB/RepB/Spo0J family partition protein [Gammaproteobacteria bacterium]|nr:MAG: ParB/RepB/Spo0J family partition protein [Gammaproteobacteria bacterium]
MATKKTGLGRGLDALLGPMTPAKYQPDQGQAPDGLAQETPADQSTVPIAGLQMLPLELLQPGAYQPRRDMHKETLEELADSIRSQGVLSPISVRALPGTTPTHYEIIAGERRWRACQIAGLAAMPVIIRDVDDEQAAAIALIENLQREDLNPLEQAEGLLRLIDEFDLTHQEAGRAVGKSRAAVSNLIRLLDLSPDALKLLASGQLDMGHARALLGLSGSRNQADAAREVVAKDLSVRQTEALVKRLQKGSSSNSSNNKATVDPDIRRLQLELGEKLGAKVAIQHTVKGAGKLVISYNSNDELEGILGHIK